MCCPIRVMIVDAVVSRFEPLYPALAMLRSSGIPVFLYVWLLLGTTALPATVPVREPADPCVPHGSDWEDTSRESPPESLGDGKLPLINDSAAQQQATNDSDSADVTTGEDPPPAAESVADQATGADSDDTASDSEDPVHQPWQPAWQTNDPVLLFGLVMAILGGVFWTSQSEHVVWRSLYRLVPMLLLCYFLPSLLTMSGIAGKEAADSLYFVASRFLLPACLVLLTMCVDLREVVRLGPKALVMFFTGTVGVVLGGPLAVFLVAMAWPELISVEGNEATWRGLATVAGSWIGGGANQTAMKVLFEPSDQLFSQMVAVDVIVAELWMAVLLIGVGHTKTIDRWLSADASSIEVLKQKMETYSTKHARIATATDLMVIGAIGFLFTGLGHWLGDGLAAMFGENFEWATQYSLDSGFFWLILFATLAGLVLSFTPARRYEGAGASRIATVFIFILVGTIGLQMDLWALLESPEMFLIGIIWMVIHVVTMVAMAWAIKAPYFFIAVGSKANIGGAASAPVVAAAFHPALAPVGVLLAVLGYVLGTVGAYLSALMMKAVSGG